MSKELGFNVELPLAFEAALPRVREALKQEGFGVLTDYPDALFERMNEEHGFFDISRTSHNLKVGDSVRILPNHICVAMNLHEQVYGVRGDEVVEVWKVEARGRLQ